MTVLITSVSKTEIVAIEGLEILKPIQIETSLEGGGYRAKALDIPFASGVGRSEDEAIKKLEESISGVYVQISSSNADFYSVEECKALMAHIKGKA